MDELLERRVPVRLVGVTLSTLRPRGARQGSGRALGVGVPRGPPLVGLELLAPAAPVADASQLVHGVGGLEAILGESVVVRIDSRRFRDGVEDPGVSSGEGVGADIRTFEERRPFVETACAADLNRHVAVLAGLRV